MKDTNEILTIPVKRRLPNDLATVVDQLLAELLGELVGLAAFSVALVDVVLHVREQVRVGAVQDGNATGGDLAIDSCEATKDDIVEHKESILAHPVPGGIEVTSLQDIEAWLNAVNVEVAVFRLDDVELGLESFGIGFLNIILDFTGTGIAIEIPHVHLNLL